MVGWQPGASRLGTVRDADRHADGARHLQGDLAVYLGVANGELAFALGSSGTSGALQRAGRIRYLAVAGPKRLPAFPDVPTAAEARGPANFDVVGWTAIAAPKGLNPAIVQKIRRDIDKALAEPDIAQRYATFGYEVFPATPEQFACFVKTESTRYAEVIKKANASLD